MDYKLLIPFILFIIGCGVTDSKSNPESSNKLSASGMKTLPLVDPYKLVTPDKGFSWYYYFNHGGIPGRAEIGTVIEIAIEKPNIYLHTGRVYYNSTMTDLWIVIDIEKKKEIVFTSFEDIPWLNAKDDLQLHKVNTVYKTYQENEELPW